MADDIAKKRAALNVGDLIKETGFVKGPSLSTMIAEHMASLPETTAKNAIAMNNMVQNSMPYNFDPRSNGVNPNYDPQAAKEFANYIPNLMGATAYHGTPHNIRGAFDLAKVGTGEGAQVYGHGMYFAQNPKVAKEYQLKLSGPKKDIVVFNGQDGYYVKKGLGSEGENIAGPFKTSSEADLFRKNLPENQNKGNLYKVDVPDEHIPKMLDWDKPISEQPHVWNAIPQDVKNAIDDLLDSKYVNTMSDAPESYTGKHLYSMLKHPEVHDILPAEVPNSSWYTGDTTNEKHVSQYLNSIGIPGIKYLDQKSRENVPKIFPRDSFNSDTKTHSTEYRVDLGWLAPNKIKYFPTKEEAQNYADSFLTRNFVSFDPAAVKILEKNDQTIAPPTYAPSEGVAPIPIQLNNPIVESAAQNALTQQAKMKAQYEIHKIAQEEQARKLAEDANVSTLASRMKP